jgi:hypothetical protein
VALSDTQPRILFIDIETKPALIYSFGIRDQHITHGQIKEDGGVICVGYKWAGERKTTVLTEWELGYSEMIRRTHELLCEADMISSYNGVSFDMPKLMGCFLREGLPPPPPLTQVDIYKAVRKMGFICNKLAYVAPLLGLGDKLKHEGLDMWKAVMEGCPKARRKMARYCAQDVRLLEDIYLKVRPYVQNHPHMGMTGAHQCGACGSHRTQSRGVRRTKASFITRIHCQNCGSWQDGARVTAR